MGKLENKIKIGILGVGRIGSAIVRGLLKTNFNGEIFLFDKNAQNLKIFASKKIKICKNACELAKKSDVIILAVKPYSVQEALEEIKDELKNKLLISLAAGVSIAKIRSITKNARICRVMLNINCGVAEGAMAYAVNKKVIIDDVNLIENIFGKLGLLVKVKEEQINAITAACASTPAFIFLVIEVISKFLEKNGIAKSVATKLAAQVLAGSGKMALESKLNLNDLIASVKTKGGTTEVGLKILREKRFTKIFGRAINAAHKRANKLEKNLK